MRLAPGGRRTRTAAGSLWGLLSSALVGRRSKWAGSRPCRAIARRTLRRFCSVTGRPRWRIMAATDRDASAAALSSASSIRMR
ncbi:hypothetical protein BKM31_36035 [[Actinomadura] parvosata subsp. kistnae]|uniref:Uncharacterized protein n=1 Tax=[Actinomadura] parvosata subsp. kistnae TaxID=1909395 RepID=A0A1V0A7F7_9ACTN|nr:hypothetical protein [Nonomuraea sp. ATCC 55076]AQZ66147.1 hypothetical protein BKM31_36035 [Nonomuraea sp. ATCC 55076]